MPSEPLAIPDRNALDFCGEILKRECFQAYVAEAKFALK